MDDDELIKRIHDTEWEVFPLDRMLPKSTVLSIFTEIYKKTENKTTLMKNSPATKRVREAYWSLFACVALDIHEKQDHLLFFPSDDRNDVSFISPNDLSATRPKMNFWEFDVKEYTQHSSNAGFDDFIVHTINPKRTTYGIIIGVHADIGTLHPSQLFFGEDDRGVFIIATDDASEDTVLIARVIFVMKKEIIFDGIIDLSKHIEQTDARIVFQDKLRGLPR